jgi:hypothetical protein
VNILYILIESGFTLLIIIGDKHDYRVIESGTLIERLIGRESGNTELSLSFVLSSGFTAFEEGLYEVMEPFLMKE